MAAQQQAVLISTVTALAEVGRKIVSACGLVGLARSTYYRIAHEYTHYQPVTDPVPQRERVQPAALTQDSAPWSGGIRINVAINESP